MYVGTMAVPSNFRQHGLSVADCYVRHLIHDDNVVGALREAHLAEVVGQLILVDQPTPAMAWWRWGGRGV